MTEPLPDLLLRPLVEAALAEDLGCAGDITSLACIAPNTPFTGALRARKPGRVAGLDCARLAFAALDERAQWRPERADGDAVGAGDVLAVISGDARAVLGAERVALNLLQRLSGIATLTSRYLEAVAGSRARITDTRKTTPGLRRLEKYAVRCGGAVNHRFGLDDAILIKDNHVAAAGGVGVAIDRARAYAGHLVRVEVEVDRLDQFDEALAHAPDVIMLDNFSLEDMATAVERAAGRVVLEASGGVDLSTVAAIAATGVDVISVGALTHSVVALDIGLDAD